MLEFLPYLNIVKNFCIKHCKIILIALGIILMLGFISYAIFSINENKNLEEKLRHSVEMIALERAAEQKELQATRSFYDRQFQELTRLYQEHDSQLLLIDANYKKAMSDISKMKSKMYKNLVEKGTQNPAALTCDLADAAGLSGCVK